MILFRRNNSIITIIILLLLLIKNNYSYQLLNKIIMILFRRTKALTVEGQTNVYRSYKQKNALASNYV